MDKKLDQYDKDFLDNVYKEMMEFTALNVQFINNILNLAETNDDAYELVVRWFRSGNSNEQRYYEEKMTFLLKKNNML